MTSDIRSRAGAGIVAVAALCSSVVLASLAQHPATVPGVLDALAPVVAIATYVAGMAAASVALFKLRVRGLLVSAIAWAAALSAARLVVEPGVAVASIGRMHEFLLERWTALSNALLWFVAVPLEVVFGAAVCGGVLVALALAGSTDAERTFPGAHAGVRQ